jgi:hypothetical protein
VIVKEQLRVFVTEYGVTQVLYVLSDLFRDFASEAEIPHFQDCYAPAENFKRTADILEKCAAEVEENCEGGREPLDTAA